MGDISLYIELLFDIIALIIGSRLIYLADDNPPKKTWGIFTVIIAAVFLYENLRIGGYINLLQSQRESINLLSFDRMIKSYIVAHIFSLIPITSLKPGWLNKEKIFFYSLPLIIICCISLSYIVFNGRITEVYTFTEILANIHKQDIIVRLALFLCSILTPIFLFGIPFYYKRMKKTRVYNIYMKLYITYAILLMVIYSIYTIIEPLFLYDIYGFLFIFFPIFISILYMKNENPFSKYSLKTNAGKGTTDNESEKAFEAYNTYIQMTNLMNNKSPFTNPDYSYADMKNELKISKQGLQMAFNYAGFTNFKEFIRFQRIQYFKKHASLPPKLPLEELMLKSGFTSTKDFTHYFVEQESITPEEYIERVSLDQ